MSFQVVISKDGEGVVLESPFSITFCVTDTVEVLRVLMGHRRENMKMQSDYSGGR